MCDVCSHRFADLTALAERSLEDRYQRPEYSGFRQDEHYRQVLRRELATTLAPPRLAHGSMILDVGCGNGMFMEEATRLGHRTLGVDISASAVAMCTQRGLSARCGNFLELEFDTAFDCVTMWDVIEHLPAPGPFVARALDVLRPGGYLVMKTPYVSPAAFRSAAAVPALSHLYLHPGRHVQFFTRRSLAALVAEAGFGRVEWLASGRMRGWRPIRSVRTLIGRTLRIAGQALGNGNLYVIAAKPA